MKGFLPILNNLLSKIFKDPMAKERTFLVFLVTGLVFMWFKKGLILGSGESGLPFYNTSRFVELLQNNWTDVPMGAGGSIGFPGLPLYATISFFQQLHIPSFMIQAIMYWIIFVVGALSIHAIASLIKGNVPLSRLSSALFYIFNPIVHISVLHRFQFPLIFFYSLMPLALLIYFKGLTSRKFTYIFILSLVTIFFSFTFVGPAFLELFFAVLISLSSIYFISSFRKKIDWFPLVYFFSFVIIFVLINSSWLIPLFASVTVDLGSRGSVKYFNSSDNVETFKAISIQIESVQSVFRLFKPNDHVQSESIWAWVYSTFPFIILSFFSMIAFILGLYKKEKELIYKFLIFLALICMFWMKGSLPPFGDLTTFIFKSLTFLQVFRNPFEKIGLLLPFAMAMPVGFGTMMIINFISRKWRLSKKIASAVILTIVFPIYMFPILSSLVFTGGSPPTDNPDIGQYVKVPEYYKNARDWLDKQGKLFKVLVLPIDGEGMTYKWDYGFSGVELSNNLFNHPMISLNTSQGYLPEMVGSIKQVLMNYPDNLWVLAKLLNVKYIMVRDDIDYVARDTENPVEVLSTIRKSLGQHFSEVARFGKLVLFELNSKEFQSKIASSTAPIYLFDFQGKGLDLIPFSNPKANEVYIIPQKNTTEDPYIKFSKKSIINGIKVENIDTKTKDPIEKLPYVSIYRDTPFYALVRLKEEIQSQFQAADNQLAFNVTLLGKRLAEINHSPDNIQAIEEYSNLVSLVGAEIEKSTNSDRAIIESMINQRQVLDKIKDETINKDKIDQLAAYLDSLFITVRAKSVYPTKNDLIYRFYTPKDASYEVLIPRTDWSRYFEGNGITDFDLDGKPTKADPIQLVKDKDSIFLGVFSLTQGVHEISFSSPKAINLTAEKLPEELVLSSVDRKPLTKIIPIAELNNAYTYGIYFEYFEEKGNVPVLGLHSDVDFINKKGEKVPRFGIALSRDNYDFGWKTYKAQFTPITASHKYEISIKIIPFGDCIAVVERPYRRYCEDNQFNQRFLKDSSTKIRNLRVEKVFTSPVILREVEILPDHNNPPQVTFETISSARYKVKVTNAQEPFFLTLSTAYDPRWRAYFTTPRPKNIVEFLSESFSGDVVSVDNHLVVNGYANGWYIDRAGSYDMFLEYSPERIFIIGKKISLVSIIFILILIIYTLFNDKIFRMKKGGTNVE